MGGDIVFISQAWEMKMVDGGLVVVSEDSGRAARRFLVRSLILLLAFSVGVVGLQVPPAVADEDELPPVGTVVRMSASGQWTEDAYDYGLVEKGSFVESIEATLVAREEAWDGSRVKDTWQGTVSGEQYAEVSNPAVYEGGDLLYAACSSYDRVGYSSKVRWEDGGQSGLPSLNVSIGADGVWTLNMSPVVLGPSATVESAPDCELSPSGPVLTASTFSVINLLEDPIRLEDTDPDPARFAAEATVPARGTTIGGGGYFDYSLRASIDAPVDSGSCKKVKKKKVAYKTITPLGGRFVPDVHWYTTKITVGQCRKKGKTYVTGLKVKRKVEKGFLPRVIGLSGWSSRTDSPTTYSPSKFPRSGTKSASARFQYTACFDLTKLLDKGGLKKHVKQRMEGPLKAGIKQVLRKYKITRINKKMRSSVGQQWRRTINQAFKKGTIRTYLKRKYRIPNKIGKWIEKAALTQKTTVKDILKKKVLKSLQSGNYDDMTAEVASGAMVSAGFKKLDRLVNFCGGRSAEKSNFRTWDVSIELSGGGKKVTVRRNTHYLHPLMRIRRA